MSGSSAGTGGAGPSAAYRVLFDRALTRLDAERAHRLGFAAVRAGRPLLSARPLVVPPGVGPVDVLGLRFAHPVGLAAGFDKNAEGVDALGALGFSFVEVGTVTALPQPGNPRPRLFRLPADRAVVNRMGFNNEGAAAVAARLAARRRRAHGGPVLGINLGKSKVVPEDDPAAVAADHDASTRLLAPHADYLVLNVSSPNTPGLRTLQAADRLAPLLATVRRSADEAREAAGLGRVPVLVKIAPDLADPEVLAVADLVRAESGTGDPSGAGGAVDGVLAANTTVTRSGLRSSPALVEATGAGGLSGPPVAARSLEILRLLRERLGPDPTLVGVGGITTAADAQERLDAGADLVQAYTAFVYEGPGWPRQVVRGLAPRRSPT